MDAITVLDQIVSLADAVIKTRKHSNKIAPPQKYTQSPIDKNET